MNWETIESEINLTWCTSNPGVHLETMTGDSFLRSEVHTSERGFQCQVIDRFTNKPVAISYSDTYKQAFIFAQLSVGIQIEN